MSYVTSIVDIENMSEEESKAMIRQLIKQNETLVQKCKELTEDDADTCKCCNKKIDNVNESSVCNVCYCRFHDDCLRFESFSRQVEDRCFTVEKGDGCGKRHIKFSNEK